MSIYTTNPNQLCDHVEQRAVHQELFSLILLQFLLPLSQGGMGNHNM